MSVPAMLDAGRTGQVMDLFFESIRLVKSRTPRARVVVLRGSTGAGRTSLLQGLYELATGQQEPPAYWPTKLVDDHLAAELTREVLTPDDFEVPAGARMPFLWLALSGRDELALSRADVQLRAHASGFARAVESISDRDRVRLLVLGQSALLLAGFVPVLGNIVQGLQTVATAQQAARDLASTWPTPESVVREALTVSTTRRFSRREDAEEQAEHDARLLAEMATHLPLVLAIDDADGLDEVTIAFMEALVRSPQARALVVMTVNTDHHPTHPAAPVDAGRVDHNDELHGLLARLPDGLLKVVDLAPFTPDELLKLILAHDATAGAADRSLPQQVVVDLIETARGAPGRLMSLLEHGVTRAALAGHAELPDDLEPLTARSNVDDLWGSLAPRARRALATLAVHGSQTLGCLVREPRTGADAVASGWVRVVPLGIEEIEQLEFRSSAFYATARARLGSELSPEQTTRVREQLVEDLMARRQTWPDLPAAVLESLFDTMIDSATEIPADLLATLLRLRRVTGREATLAALSKAEAGPLRGPLLLATAEALADAGHASRALDLFSDELQRLSGLYGAGDVRTLSTLHNLASAWAFRAEQSPPEERRAQYDRSIELYEELVAGWTRYRPGGAIDRRLPKAHRDLARVCAKAIRYQDAVQHGHECVAEMTECGDFGPADVTTLTTRGEVARWVGQAGDQRGALNAFTALLPDCQRWLGPDHLATLDTKSHIAEWIGETGDAAGAIAAFKHLLADEIRVHGPDHPRTLITRANIAAWYAESGDAQTARATAAELLPETLTALGPDHLDTLALRFNLAQWTGRTGDPQGALTATTELLPDLVRVLGPDHPLVLTARDHAAVWTGRTGDPRGGLTALTELLPDLLRVLGPDHPYTLATRYNIAEWTGENEDPHGAVTAYRRLLPDLIRVHGADHPNTLSVRAHLARWTALTDGLAASLDAYNELLPDLVRVLGPDHPQTIETSRWIAYLTDHVET